MSEKMHFCPNGQIVEVCTGGRPGGEGMVGGVVEGLAGGVGGPPSPVLLCFVLLCFALL